jgi:O-antigen ligase
MCWWAGVGMGAALILSVVVMMAQHRFGSAFYGDLARGVSGQMPHPLSVGAVLLLPFALAGAVIGGRHAFGFLVAAGLFVAIVLSWVRTALIGGLIVLGALLIVTVTRRGWTRVAGAVIALSVAVGVYSVRDRIAERFADLTLLSASGAAQGGAGSGRLDIWRTAMDHAFDSVEHAAIGRGAQASLKIMTRILGNGVGAQNDFLDFLLAGGLVLGICYLALLIWMAANPVRILRDGGQSPVAKSFAVLTLGGVMAFAVMSMLNGIATYQPAVAAGLLVGLCRGMSFTPGDTFLDGPQPLLGDESATREMRVRDP